MYKTTIMGLLVSLTLWSCTGPDLEQRAADSRAATQAFMQTLKSALQRAMKSGGPVNAIAVCNKDAPAIAGTMSAQKQWTIARTSLKVRNPSNKADDWEHKVLEDFERRKAQGEDPKTLEYYAVVKRDGGAEFRYMKAIPTAELCLTCHGGEISPEISAKLQELYPGDQATGFSVGDIRGAFTIRQPM